MNDVKIFNSEQFGQIRIIEQNGEVWFVGKDVTDILGYQNPNEAMADHVDAEDKLNSKTLSSFDLDLGQRGGWLINESGLYSLVLSSKLPTAKAFKRWVTSEVLPSIRKHGMYAVDQLLDDPDLAIKAFTALKEERQKRLEAEQSIAIMKPKADYFDALVDRNLLTNFRETAKELDLKEKDFIEFLFDHKYVYRDQKGKLMPYADKNKGLFEVKEAYNGKSRWSGMQTLITPKGRETFRLLYQKIG